MNERYLRWDSSAQRQLIMIWVAQQLDVSMSELEGAPSRVVGGWQGSGSTPGWTYRQASMSACSSGYGPRGC